MGNRKERYYKKKVGGHFRKKSCSLKNQQQAAATASASEAGPSGAAGEQFAEVPPVTELAVEPGQQQAAATSSASEAGPAGAAGEQFAEVPPVTELAVEPGAAQQQPPQQSEVTQEAPKPRGRLRQRAPQASGAGERKHDKNLRRAGPVAGAVGDEERLAQLVRGHPVLYQQHYAQLGGRAQTRYAWFDVGRRMQRPESECISMWKHLKDRYRGALSRRKRTLEQGLKVKPSKYEKYMSFMKPFLYVWKKVAAADEAGSEGDAAPSTPERGRAEPSAPERSRAEPRNTLVEFFRILGETVKAFPKDMKNGVKSEVLKVVSDARELVLSNNSVEQLFIVEDIKEEPMDVPNT